MTDPFRRLTLPRRRGSLLDGPDFIAKELAARAPGFTTAATASVKATSTSMSVAHEVLRRVAHPKGDAMRLVLAQTANDWVDLVFELNHGRGRAALRAARSLFEHHVTAESIRSSIDDAQRYLDHLPVADRHFLDLQRLEKYLRGGDLKAHRHEHHKLDRDTKKAAADAIARYGPAFRRSWSALNLKDRAATFGLQDGYHFYRVASLPVHGAAAGIYGGKQTIDGHDVYRTGPFLAPCPVAAIYGTYFCDGVLRAVADLSGTRPVRDWHDAIGQLDEAITEYAAAATAIDRKLWPDTPPVNIAPMLVLKSRGESELWLALPEAMLAYDFSHGRYQPTTDQDAAANALFQVLANLDIDRLGVLFLDAWNPELADLPASRPEALDAVIPDAPIRLFRDGTIGIPEGLDFLPYLDDILSR